MTDDELELLAITQADYELTIGRSPEARDVLSPSQILAKSHPLEADAFYFGIISDGCAVPETSSDIVRRHIGYYAAGALAAHLIASRDTIEPTTEEQSDSGKYLPPSETKEIVWPDRGALPL